MGPVVALITGETNLAEQMQLTVPLTILCRLEKSCDCTSTAHQHCDSDQSCRSDQASISLLSLDAIDGELN